VKLSLSLNQFAYKLDFVKNLVLFEPKDEHYLPSKLACMMRISCMLGVLLSFLTAGLSPSALGAMGRAWSSTKLSFLPVTKNYYYN